MDFFNKFFGNSNTVEAARKAKDALVAKQAQEKIDLETKQKAEIVKADEAIATQASAAPVVSPPPGPGIAPMGGKGRSKRTKRNRKSKKGRTGRKSSRL